MNVAPFQANSQRIGSASVAVCGGGGTWRVRIRNSGPVAVRVGDSEVTFERGFMLAPNDPWLEILTDDLVYAIGPPTAAGIGQAQLDWIAETR